MNLAPQIFKQGGVIAYPTEGVFGLGCDPDNELAIKKLLNIKQRPQSKGLILLAGHFKQLTPYLDLTQLSHQKIQQILSYWPNGITQVLPAHKSLTSLLTGDFSTIAVRVTTQSDVVSLCQQTSKPIVSTSANLTGSEPAKTWQTLDPKLIAMIDHLIKGETLGYSQPSKIIDGLTGEVFRT